MNTRKKQNIVEKIIEERESNTGRNLTEDERRECISEKFGIAEYFELMNLRKTGSLEISGYDTDKGIDLLNSEAKPLYMESVSNDPQAEYLTRLDMQNFKDALKLVLQNTQERSRECYRSLLTAYCIEKSMIFDDIIPLLDNGILETYQKNGKAPNNYEIYLKYHPEVKKEGAGVRASQLLKGFLKNLETYLKQKNPEFFQ
jgi:hypothetical protein